MANGTVACWGDNEWGDLGNGTYNPSNIPVLVSGLTNAVAITVGGHQACALLANGTVACWGDNSSGQLGNGTNGNNNTSNVPVVVRVSTFGHPPLRNVVAVSTGDDYSCALLSNGTAECWGYNGFGQLGNGANGIPNGARNADTTFPVLVRTATNGPALTSLVAISAGFEDSCALLANGTAECWGYNNYGQLGNGTNGNNSISNVPVLVRTATNGPALANVVGITVPGQHTCGLLANGHIECWGDNSAGQLGNGITAINPSFSDIPVLVRTATNGPALANVVAISAGSFDSCAMLANGTAECWGYNNYGQLGNRTNGNNSISNVPVTVSNLSPGTNVVAISAGGQHSCALLANSTVECWGYNGFGQLGDGIAGNPDSNIPATVRIFTNGPALTNVVAISAGDLHSCALLATGQVECWGNNNVGQLGHGTNNNISNIPVLVRTPGVFGTPLTNVVAIAAGGAHSCALLATGHVECWGGNNSVGDLGNGNTNANAKNPVVVHSPTNGPMLTNAVAISAGVLGSCALLANGQAVCWGAQLGNGTNAISATSNFPVVVRSPTNGPALTNAVAITVGVEYSCALLANGQAVCWGLNLYGELGNGTNANSSNFPVVVHDLSNGPTLPNVVAIAAGHDSCALLADGTAVCWGDDGSGELGNGTNGFANNSDFPVVVHSLTNGPTLPSVIAITSGGSGHSCALLADSTAVCWGNNNVGQLGNGTNGNNSDFPVFVS